MLFRHLYDPKLAQASYLIGCQATGEAIVVDPLRDADLYLAAAAAEGLRITHVTETHIHADFASGARELAARAGARLLLSDEGGPDWRYAFARDAGAVLLKDGDHFMVGHIRFDVWHTPGHTPEHLAFVVTDTPASAAPLGILTGDWLFVGDVGRPDLLEKAAKVEHTMVAGARTLFRSLQRVRDLPDHVQVWPGHGAGSACGKALGAVPASTVGYEKLVNWGLAITDEERFVREVLSGQPDPPPYFAVMKRINREGPPLLGGAPRPRLLAPAEFHALARAGDLVLDLRAAEVYAAGHVPRALNLPYGRSFLTWAGWLVPESARLLLVLDRDDPALAAAVARDLALIGLDDVAGYVGATVVDDRAAHGERVATTARATVAEARALVEEGAVHVLDVRTGAEWSAGHLPGAQHIPLGELAERVGEVPKDRPVLVHCQGGARSAIAVSVLERTGRENTVDLLGGFTAWRQAGGPVVTDQAVGVM